MLAVYSIMQGVMINSAQRETTQRWTLYRCIDSHYLVMFSLGLRSSTNSNKTLDTNLWSHC